jgi:hypothetical protein
MRTHTQDGFDDIVSPLLAETLLWFVSRWSATYLTIHRQKTPARYAPHTHAIARARDRVRADNEYRCGRSERLAAAYGSTGGMIPNMIQFFFSSISSILMHWSGAEPNLAVQVRCRPRHARCGTTRHDTTRHDTTRHDTTRHDTTRHGTARHGTTRHDQRHDTTNDTTNDTTAHMTHKPQQRRELEIQ